MIFRGRVYGKVNEICFNNVPARKPYKTNLSGILNDFNKFSKRRFK